MTDGPKQSELLEKMLRIRCFEEKAIELSRLGLTPGRMHPCIGQEAVAAGACSALERQDLIVSTHRGGGHLLAMGASARTMFAEYMGRRTGYSGGKGGPMHISELELGVICTNGIVGSGIPVAAGAALAAQMRTTRQVVLCFFGDGASNTGSFHEGLNLSAVWRLPVVFLCENNQFGESMPIRDAVAVKHIAERAHAYGMLGRVVDGNDVLDVLAGVAEAVQRARNGDGPTLVEAETYRIAGHFDGESSHYRDPDEIAEWRTRDPIARLRTRMLDDHVMDEPELSAMERRISTEIERAADQAVADPVPSLSSLLSDVWAPVEKELQQ